MTRIKCFSDIKSTAEKQQHAIITLWNEKIAPFWPYRDITPHSDMKNKRKKFNLCLNSVYGSLRNLPVNHPKCSVGGVWLEECFRFSVSSRTVRTLCGSSHSELWAASAFISQFMIVQVSTTLKAHRWGCLVGVDGEGDFEAAQLVALSAQHALRAVVPVGQPVGQIQVGQVEVRLRQRVWALRRGQRIRCILGTVNRKWYQHQLRVLTTTSAFLQVAQPVPSVS